MAVLAAHGRTDVITATVVVGLLFRQKKLFDGLTGAHDHADSVFFLPPNTSAAAVTRMLIQRQEEEVWLRSEIEF